MAYYAFDDGEMNEMQADNCRRCRGYGKVKFVDEGGYDVFDCEDCEGTGFEAGCIRFLLAQGATEEQALKAHAKRHMLIVEGVQVRMRLNMPIDTIAKWMAEQQARLVEELELYLGTKRLGVKPEIDITW